MAEILFWAWRLSAVTACAYVPRVTTGEACRISPCVVLTDAPDESSKVCLSVLAYCSLLLPELFLRELLSPCNYLILYGGHSRIRTYDFHRVNVAVQS